MIMKNDERFVKMIQAVRNAKLDISYMTNHNSEVERFCKSVIDFISALFDDYHNDFDKKEDILYGILNDISVNPINDEFKLYRYIIFKSACDVLEATRGC